MDSLQQAVMRGRYERDQRPSAEVVDPFFLVNLLAEISATWGVPVDGMKSDRRFHTYFNARAEFCYRAFMESNATLVRIGKILGDRDHTTIRNAIAVHCLNRGLPLPPGVNWNYWIERRKK